MSVNEAAHQSEPWSNRTETGKLAWESPEAVEIDLGAAKAANTNSNFDGASASS